jgi:hypothetical protein
MPMEFRKNLPLQANTRIYMRKWNFTIALIFGILVSYSQNQLQLATPLVSYPSLFFKESTSLLLEFAQPGTQIVYTTNGSEPTIKSKRYQSPILINERHSKLKIKTIGKQFLPSATLQLEFFRQGLPIAAITGTPPNQKYPADGLGSLHDTQSGTTAPNDGRWLGYHGDTATWIMAFQKPEQPKQLMLHCLHQPDSWIFLPAKIVVYALAPQKNEYIAIGNWVAAPPLPEALTGASPILITLSTTPKTTQLKVVAYPLMQMPVWHIAPGEKAWLFADEMIAY